MPGQMLSLRKAARSVPARRVRAARQTIGIVLQLHEGDSDSRSTRAAYRVAIASPAGGPVKSLLDPTFKYVPSAETDIRKTFARVRRETRQLDRPPPTPLEGSRKITHLFGEKKGAA